MSATEDTHVSKDHLAHEGSAYVVEPHAAAAAGLEQQDAAGEGG
eukprot:CAMPEP_0202874508 /NCGR_PEP_ID=MMETSP1391-20130828/25540_1 /ASSEMBLY_ACC=CAM_ASM_000867 /TAXON_ID=1034604 /ORGANISM="Chlamydomonas leiostraca, Strain SAG 11-49" /LENGTH=43 /DNA_ID= /DNA_START= /DNA_END= /DNA_ORIENTATION=